MKRCTRRRFLLGAAALGGAATLGDVLLGRRGFDAMPSTFTPFQDGALSNICGATGSAYGEPTALLSDDQTQIDLWFTQGGTTPAYGVSTDGTTFSGFLNTNVPSGYKRGHILKDNGTYYLYVAGSSDTSIHLFTGTDKIHFTDQGQVLGLGSGWDVSGVANCFVWREGASWYMLYEGSNGSVSSIGLVTASAPGGPWTRWAGNPVLPGPNGTAGNPELPRFGSSVTKYGGIYHCYYHETSTTSAISDIRRASSPDLHTWTDEGVIDGVWHSNTPLWNGTSGWTYGDHCLVPFQNETYLLWSPSNQVNASHIDGAIDHRNELQLMAVPPNGATDWRVGSAAQPGPFG